MTEKLDPYLFRRLGTAFFLGVAVMSAVRLGFALVAGRPVLAIDVAGLVTGVVAGWSLHQTPPRES